MLTSLNRPLQRAGVVRLSRIIGGGEVNRTITVNDSNFCSKNQTNLIYTNIREFSGYKGFRNPGARISESSVFLQNGPKISELPLIVRKVNDIFELYKRLGIKQTSSELQPTEVDKDKFVLVYPKEISIEEMEIIDGFNRCFNSSSIFRLLETIPRQEVTPLVAAHALRKIIDLENNFEMRNPGFTRETIRGSRRSQDTFLRMAFMTMLLDIVCNSRQPKVILDGLSTVMRDQFPADLATYKDRLLEELLFCVSEGVFSLIEVCQAINTLSMFYEDRKKSLEAADKLWFGIVDQHTELNNPEAIVAVFGTLPSLKKSRNIVLKVLEKKALENWEKYDPGDILEILRVLVEIKYDSVGPNFLKMISEWLAVNIHKVKESEMLAIVYSLIELNYVDDRIIHSLEKVVRHRGCQIHEKDLVSTICDFCFKFRVRSPVILEGVSEYFIHFSNTLSVPQIFSIGRIFGELDFHPTTGFKFWRELEYVLEEKFIQFRPIEVIQLLVSFIYIEKFPLNFTNKLFNPYFLDRLHSQSEEEINFSRQELKLFDAGMKLECRGYGGPYLPKDTSYKNVNIDFRARKMSKLLFDPLGELLEDYSRIGHQVVLSSLPLHASFIVDLMIYATRSEALLRFGFKTENSSNIAVLIHLPEHYDRNKSNLIGSQVMKIRHLRTMGFRVMTVDYEAANKIRGNANQLKEYVEQRYKIAVTPVHPGTSGNHSD